MKKKKIAVLGLGVFGASIAKTLNEYGQFVLGIDHDEDLVNKAGEYTSECICGDFTHLPLLKKLNLDTYDVIVVGESSNLEASLLTITHLKTLGAKYIIAKAKNATQRDMLEKLGADFIIRPETQIAERVAKSILNKSIGDMIELDDDYSLIDISVLHSWTGRSLAQLNLRSNYNINVVGIKHENDHSYNMDIDPHMALQPKDRLLVLVHKETLKKLSYLEK